MSAAVTTELKLIGHWIGGGPVRGSSGRRGPVYNPATGEQTGEVDFASVEEVDRAVTAAKAAFPAWRQWSLSKRADLLFRIYNLVDEHREDLARLLTAEHGKVLSDALGEVQRGIEVIEYVCGIPTLLKGGYTEQAATGIDVYSIRQPLGVVAGITPFNFPAMVPMWMWAPAIGKRVQALGGAKNHMVVLPDADIDMAADAAVSAGYGSAGERCMAISVVVAVGDAGDPLVGAIKERLPKVKVGDGMDPRSEMGPLVTREHRDKVASYLESGEAQGATLVADGRATAPDGGGFFLGVSLLDDVTPAMDCYRDEIFGPVLSVVRVPTYADALQLVNDNPYGNGVAIFTRDGGVARRFQFDVNVGMVGVNVPIPVPVAYYSFGGWKSSLFGDRHIYGPEGIDFYTRTKAVTSRWPDPATSKVDLGFPQTR